MTLEQLFQNENDLISQTSRPKKQKTYNRHSFLGRALLGIVGLLGAAQTAYAIASPNFTAEVNMHPGKEEVIGGVPNYLWSVKLENDTLVPVSESGNVGDYSVIGFTAYTPETSGHDFSGNNSLYPFWDNGVTTSESNKFSSEPMNSLGYLIAGIDGQTKDESKDDVTAYFLSKHNTLIDSKIDFSTESAGIYTIDTQLPGPEKIRKPITNLNISGSTLSWPSVSNTTYKIESNTNLLTDTWNTLTNITAKGTNTVLDIATTNNVMFYRGKEE